jgi:hypothetical protein
MIPWRWTRSVLKDVVAHPDRRLLDISLLQEEQPRDAEPTFTLPITDEFIFDL